MRKGTRRMRSRTFPPRKFSSSQRTSLKGVLSKDIWFILKDIVFSTRKKVVGRLLRHRPHFLFWVDKDIFSV